jgi:hypothetical protein
MVLAVDRRKIESTNFFREAIKPLDTVTSIIQIRIRADLQDPYMQTQLFRWVQIKLRVGSSLSWARLSTIFNNNKFDVTTWRERSDEVYIVIYTRSTRSKGVHTEYPEHREYSGVEYLVQVVFSLRMKPLASEGRMEGS